MFYRKRIKELERKVDEIQASDETPHRNLVIRRPALGGDGAYCVDYENKYGCSFSILFCISDDSCHLDNLLRYADMDICTMDNETRKSIEELRK